MNQKSPPAAAEKAPPKPGKKAISLGLQGGGSHGAFTWGVLDRLLADPRIEIDGISGTSAGAVNAVALAHGFAKARETGDDPRAGARAMLARIWNHVVALGGVQSARSGLVNLFWPVPLLTQAFKNLVSPYQLNPLDYSPLRDLLTREIDFKAAGALASPRVFVCATRINTGEPEIFFGEQLTLASVMASASLPMLSQAVRVENDYYWDGGFSGNPSLSPLIDDCASRDLLLVQLNPLARDEIPMSAQDIADRVNELTFNASLLAQLRDIDFINQLLDKDQVAPHLYKKLLLHRIDGGNALLKYGAATKLSVDPRMIHELFELGSSAAHAWLGVHFSDLGERGTLDFERDYGPKLRLNC